MQIINQDLLQTINGGLIKPALDNGIYWQEPHDYTRDMPGSGQPEENTSEPTESYLYYLR